MKNNLHFGIKKFFSAQKLVILFCICCLSLVLNSCSKEPLPNQIDQNNLPSELEKSFLKSSNKEFKETIERTDNIISSKPDVAEAYFDRGIAKLNSGDSGGGLHDLRKAQDLFKKQKNEIGYTMVSRTIENKFPPKSIKDEVRSKGSRKHDEFGTVKPIEIK